MRPLSKVSDFRALAGAGSLLLVGIHLSIMSGLYFSMDRQSFRVLHTGLWWEIALNLQIVCYFLLYLCHRVRKHHSEPWKRWRAWFRFLVAILGVSIPSILLVTAAQKGWFENPPMPDDVIYFSAFFFSVWISIAYLLPLLLSLLSGGKKLVYLSLGKGGIKSSILYVSPLLLLLVLAAMEMVQGGKLHFILWPFFAYLQGAMSYLGAAFTPRKGGQMGFMSDEIQLNESD